MRKRPFSREVVVHSDFAIHDIRSSRTISLDGSRGRAFFLRPVEDFELAPPSNASDGIYRLFVLPGADQREMAVSAAFEILGAGSRKEVLQAQTLAEFQIIVLNEGFSARYFLTNPLAYIHQAEETLRTAITYSRAFN